MDHSTVEFVRSTANVLDFLQQLVLTRKTLNKIFHILPYGFPLQVFCVIVFLTAVSLFGTLISQLNEIVAANVSGEWWKILHREGGG